jgi:serine/threonine-protein kinase
LAATVPAAAPVAAEEVVYEEPVPPGRDGLGWPWVVLISLLVVAAILGVLLLTGTIGASKVRVPNVIGISDAAAKVKLNRAELEIDIEQVVSNKPKGIVISQNPTFGSRVKEGTVVSVSVSSGPGDAQVPPVEGLTRRDARKALDRARFRIRERRERSTEVAKGQAIRTEPGAGTQLEIGLVVTLYISAGPPDVTVPDVTGRPLEDARAMLRDAGFRVTTTDEETVDAEPGTVLSQRPGAASEAPEGSTVDLTVARAPSKVDVPDVTGETDSDAIRILQDAGLKIATERQDVETPEDDGVVLDQDPRGGRSAKPGDTVTIVVGRFNPDLDPEGGATTTPGTSTVPGAR